MTNRPFAAVRSSFF
ncbi:hypothetical protein Chy1_0044, partial [Mycobacterium phage Chy1]